MALPGEQRRDDEVVLAHVVRDLELEVHVADIVRGEHVCAVVPVARWTTRCAGAPTGDRVGGEAHSAAYWVSSRSVASRPADGSCTVSRSGSPSRVELSITASSARAR